AWLPALHFIGALGLLLLGRDKLRGLCMVLFSLYYSAAWFLVLPEQSHLGQLVLPLTVTGGVGLWSLGRLARWLVVPWTSRLSSLSNEMEFIPFRRSLGVLALAGVAATLAWALACALTYSYSRRHRDNYI